MNGMHAVLPASPDRGLLPGVVFTLRNRNQNVNLNQINRLHPYYLIYIGMDGKIVVPHTDVKRLLDLVRSVCKPADQPIPSAYHPFNTRTEDGRNMGVYSNLLNAAIASILHIKEEKDLDSLFSGQKTTALVGKASGADDFELVAFLVVEPALEPVSSIGV
jgi:hypothetical protein